MSGFAFWATCVCTARARACLSQTVRATSALRVVDTVYLDAASLVPRLAAAWGAMFPTLPATHDRNAFFKCVAETAVARASTSACDPRPVVVRSRVLDVAVPAAA